MPRKLSIVAAAILVAGQGAMVASPRALADGPALVEITVINLTRGQIISPVVVASHSARLAPLFELGEPASDELAGVAEDADLDPFIAALEADSAVHQVKTVFGENNGPIVPGESASVVLEVPGRFRRVSMAGMLVSTNDAFTALRAVRVPAFGGSTYRTPAYDSGSEVNNEDCDFIPGPPCTGGGVRQPVGAEGYVHIHGGIHGIGDLEPSEHDWRNPVVEVTIRRVRPDDDD